jgi:hypothetical protein
MAFSQLREGASFKRRSIRSNRASRRVEKNRAYDFRAAIYLHRNEYRPDTRTRTRPLSQSHGQTEGPKHGGPCLSMRRGDLGDRGLPRLQMSTRPNHIPRLNGIKVTVPGIRH